MSVAGMMTPIRSSSYRNLQLNAGLLFAGTAITADTALELKTAVEAIIAAGDNDVQETLTRTGASSLVMNYVSGCLGITRGGGSFVVNQETRQTEADGVRYRFVGDTFVDSVDAQLTGTVLELTPGNLKRILDGTQRKTGDTSTTRFRYQLRTSLRETNPYLKHLTWVGDLLDGRYVMIHFNWALNTAGMNMTFTDKGEATMPFEFHAYQAQVENYDYAPFDITIFRDVYDTDVRDISCKVGGISVGLTPDFDAEEDEYEIEAAESSSHLVVKVKLADKRAALVTEVYQNSTKITTIAAQCFKPDGIDIALTDTTDTNSKITGITPPFDIVFKAVDVEAEEDGTEYTVSVALEDD